MATKRSTYPPALIELGELRPTLHAAALYEWAEREGWTTYLNHRGRISIAATDAYEYAERSREKAVAHQQLERQASVERAALIAATVEKRRELYAKEYEKEYRRPDSGHWDANRRAWAAIHAAEANLPADIRNELDCPESDHDHYGKPN